MTVSVSAILLTLATAPAASAIPAADTPTVVVPAVSAAPVVTDPAAAPAAPVPAVDPAATPAPPVPAGKRDIVVTGRAPIPGDPLARVNAKSYAVIQSVDRAFVGPVAMAYKSGLPEPVRDGLHNFLTNLREPVVFVNYLLQLKPGKAARTFGRFAVNSTIGVGGLVDMAKRKPFGMPHKFNGFEDTFACYGIGAGPYLFLPLVGPTTIRDVIGITLDHAMVPFVVGGFMKRPYYALPAAAIDTLDIRVAMDDDLRRIREESGDPYAAARNLYLRQRYEHLKELCPKQADKALRLTPRLKAELTPTASVTVPAPPPIPATSPVAPAVPTAPAPTIVVPQPAPALAPEAPATPTPGLPNQPV